MGNPRYPKNAGSPEKSSPEIKVKVLVSPKDPPGNLKWNPNPQGGPQGFRNLGCKKLKLGGDPNRGWKGFKKLLFPGMEPWWEKGGLKKGPKSQNLKVENLGFLLPGK